MQSMIKGYAMFYKGTFEDQAKKKERMDKGIKDPRPDDLVPYYQVAIIERTDNGINLVKISVPSEHITEAEKLDSQMVEVVCDMKETNYNNKSAVKFVYSKGRVIQAPVAKAA